MKCPQCSVENGAGSRFCEDCGSVLAPLAGGAKRSDDPLVECQADGCHAGPTQIDQAGFCTSCGARRKADARDHFYVALSVRVAGVCDIGERYKENQDFFAIGAHGSNLGLIVQDGVSTSQNPMIGSKAGSEAARDHLVATLAKGGEFNADEVMKQAAHLAQEAVCKTPFEPALVTQLPPAQATFVGALVVGKRVTIGWVGDSRAYWVAGRKTATQISVDDSWVEYAVRELKMTREEALADRRAHAIVESLGADDKGNNPGISPDTRTLNMSEAGILLLVSDGFWNYADKEGDTAKIVQLINQLPVDADALTIARHLVKFAKNAGGHDNITVVVAIF